MLVIPYIPEKINAQNISNVGDIIRSKLCDGMKLYELKYCSFGRITPELRYAFTLFICHKGVLFQRMKSPPVVEHIFF